MRRYIDSVILIALTLTSVLLALKSSPEPIPVPAEYTFLKSLIRPFSIGNSIVFSLCIGFVVSSIFYGLVVVLPEKKKRRRIAENLRRQYREIKEDCIATFLSAMVESYPADLPRQLSDQTVFKHYFKTAYSESQSRWHQVLNGLDDYHLNAVLTELEILREAVLYTLNNVEVRDDDVFAFFHRLSQHVLKLRNIDRDYDEVKSLSGFLWELFAGWSLIEGYRDEDIVELMIAKVA